MELTIQSEHDNKLCGRKEGVAHISGIPTTPSLAEVKKALASKLKTGEELVDVQSVKSAFGGGNVVVKFYAYNDASSHSLFYRKPKVKKEAAPTSAGKA